MEYTTTLIPLSLIDDNPFQTREAYDPAAISELAASIQRDGLLQPPMARLLPGGRYQLAFGHRRLRAYQQLNLQEGGYALMPLVVRVLSDEQMALAVWQENKARSDITPIEEAKALARYADTFGWKQKELAQHLGVDPSTVSNRLRLLRLPESVQAQLQAGTITERHAIAMLPLFDLPASLQTAMHAWMGGRSVELKDLLTDASGFTSEQLRSGIETYIDRATVVLEGEAFATQVIDLEHVQAARCKECPIRLKSSNRCPDRFCANLKRGALQAQQAAAAAASVGLPTVSELLTYDNHDRLYGVNLPSLRAKADERACGNLAVGAPEYGIQHTVPGHPGYGVICAHGKGKRCACLASLNRSDDPTASPKARAKHDAARIDAELVAPALQAVTAALTRTDVTAWRQIWRRIDHATPAATVQATTEIAQIQAAIAKALIEDTVRWSRESGQYGEAEKKLRDLVTAFGAPDPFPAKEAPTPIPADASPIVRTAQAALTWLGGELQVRGLDAARGYLPLFAGDDPTEMEDMYEGELLTWLEESAAACYLANDATWPADVYVTSRTPSDHEAVACVLIAICAIEQGLCTPEDAARRFGYDLEGIADAVDDATYERLATRWGTAVVS